LTMPKPLFVSRRREPLHRYRPSIAHRVRTLEFQIFPPGSADEKNIGPVPDLIHQFFLCATQTIHQDEAYILFDVQRRDRNRQALFHLEECIPDVYLVAEISTTAKPVRPTISSSRNMAATDSFNILPPAISPAVEQSATQAAGKAACTCRLSSAGSYLVEAKKIAACGWRWRGHPATCDRSGWDLSP